MAQRVKYADYIASDAWRERKRRYYAKHGKACRKCGASERVQLHHRAYACLGREPDGHLVALCDPCHTTVHRLAKWCDISVSRATGLFLRYATWTEQVHFGKRFAGSHRKRNYKGKRAATAT